MTLFDYAESTKNRDSGMKSATQGRAEILSRARILARHLANFNGKVTADDVRREFEYRGGNWEDLGNAAGSIFKESIWICVGFENSTVASSHARIIRIWALK